MQNWKPKKESSSLEKELERLLEVLKNMDPATDVKYADVADQLVKLYKLKEVDSKQLVSRDALAASATSIFSIFMILNYEHAHVMTSKALGFVWKAAR